MDRQPSTHPVALPAVVWRPALGAFELAVAEAAAAAAPRPQRATALLDALIEGLEGAPMTPALARSLSCGTREWLLRRAALRFRPDLAWFEADCDTCGAAYDLSLDLRAMPLREPGAAFPVASVETSLGRRGFEAPNGGHEEALAEAAGPDPRRRLLALCGLSPEAETEAHRFTEADCERIDAALEEISPELGEAVASTCPSCGGAAVARVDPFRFGYPAPRGILREVHLLASAYGWSQEAILAMPAARRHDYAALIERDRQARLGHRGMGLP
ncbi:hypothetical protein E0493_18565 [Roseomonas sp. M0104]|uniref:Phage baseplate protein n=1 Tax=Teichococcus coralli TaxID=2545983 RepID=A0A845BEH9_9PROT|nr:hypothetical protein [Pseudoroseomonas coralli]MXP65355.1 hypothetical protein [Pseudoroseomonas coralli]